VSKKGEKRAPVSGDVATNRRAHHKFELVERMEAGIELLGTEVKSLRGGKAQMTDAYAVVEDGEVWLRNLHIPPYPPAAQQNHEPMRTRKLLLHRAEIERLESRTKESGLTLVPLQLYFSGSHVKVELAVARGKRSYDKRQDLAKRDAQREIARAIGRRAKGVD
jgi:SsrA-binding protein